MGKFKAALIATGVIILVILVCALMALVPLIPFIIFYGGGLGFIWWRFYTEFKE